MLDLIISFTTQLPFHWVVLNIGILLRQSGKIIRIRHARCTAFEKNNQIVTNALTSPL
jgi:hypothetical protein